MSGVMPLAERDRAIKRLQKAAEVVLCYRPYPRQLSLQEQKDRLEAAWRVFPECERDAEVPNPRQILKICKRYEEMKVEQALLAANVCY